MWKLLPAAAVVAGDSDAQVINLTDFWVAISPPFIGYNPATHDKTIHEFPYYSFLVADLHAHLINLTFVLLFIALLVVFLQSSKRMSAARNFWRTETLLIQNDEKYWFKKEFSASRTLLKETLQQPVFLLCSLLLGIFMMCNFWDFAIYMVVISMALLIVNLRGYGKLGTWETVPVFLFQVIVIFIPFLFLSNPYLALLGFAAAAAVCFALLFLVGDSFTITGAQISLLFFLSHLVTLPFNANFEPMAKSLALSINHTPLFQLLIMWGTHLFVGTLFIVFIIRRRAVEKNDINAAAVRSRGRVSRFLAGMNPIDLFVCGLFICGLIFVFLPEVVYVVDIYSGDYKRANTMFKFTYQAFVMLSLVFGYAIARIAMTSGRKSKVDRRWSFVSILLILSMLLPAYYPFVATKQWLGDFKIENYQGLDGIIGLNDKDILETVQWVNANINGQPVMLESYGDSYTEYDQISAYTGLPTLMGWQTHEWLWRTSKEVSDGFNQVVKPRQMDVKAMYEFVEDDAVKALFEKYEVEYIVVGILEKTKFPDINEEKLQSLGKIVFKNESVYIIKNTIPSHYSTVTFKNWDGSTLATQSINYEGSATAPADPLRPGYTFNGWDTEFNSIRNDLTVTAIYTINSYTVSFKNWNGDVLDLQRVEYDKPATAPAVPERTGYTFAGWDVSLNHIEDDLVATAQYRINQYTIRFKDWNGKTLKKQTVDYNESATAPASPIRAGYTFRGWNAAFDKITGNRTVTAIYSVNSYSVVFKDWDGSILDTQSIHFEGSATAPTDPLRTGYTFTGWDKTFDIIKNDLTVTAIYTIID